MDLKLFLGFLIQIQILNSIFGIPTQDDREKARIDRERCRKISCTNVTLCPIDYSCDFRYESFGLCCKGVYAVKVPLPRTVQSSILPITDDHNNGNKIVIKDNQMILLKRILSVAPPIRKVNSTSNLFPVSVWTPIEKQELEFVSQGIVITHSPPSHSPSTTIHQRSMPTANLVEIPQRVEYEITSNEYIREQDENQVGEDPNSYTTSIEIEYPLQNTPGFNGPTLDQDGSENGIDDQVAISSSEILEGLLLDGNYDHPNTLNTISNQTSPLTSSNDNITASSFSTADRGVKIIRFGPSQTPTFTTPPTHQQISYEDYGMSDRYLSNRGEAALLEDKSILISTKGEKDDGKEIQVRKHKFKHTTLKCRKELICVIYTLCPDKYHCHYSNPSGNYPGQDGRSDYLTGECCSDGSRDGNSKGMIQSLPNRKLTYPEEKDLNDFHVHYEGKLRCLQMACNSTKQCKRQDRDYVCEARHTNYGICCQAQLMKIEYVTPTLSPVIQIIVDPTIKVAEVKDDLEQSDTLIRISPISDDSKEHLKNLDADPTRNSKKASASRNSFDSIIVSVVTPKSIDNSVSHDTPTKSKDIEVNLKTTRAPRFTYSVPTLPLLLDDVRLPENAFQYADIPVMRIAAVTELGKDKRNLSDRDGTHLMSKTFQLKTENIEVNGNVYLNHKKENNVTVHDKSEITKFSTLVSNITELSHFLTNESRIELPIKTLQQSAALNPNITKSSPSITLDDKLTTASSFFKYWNKNESLLFNHLDKYDIFRFIFERRLISNNILNKNINNVPSIPRSKIDKAYDLKEEEGNLVHKNYDSHYKARNYSTYNRPKFTYAPS